MEADMGRCNKLRSSGLGGYLMTGGDVRAMGSVIGGKTNHPHEIVCERNMLMLLPVTCVVCGD